MTIACPHCSKEISIDEALSHQLKEDLKLQASKETAAQVEEEKLRLRKQMEVWQKEQQEKLQKLAEEEASKKSSQFEKELETLKEEAVKREKQLEEAQLKELELRKKQNELDEKMRTFELEKQRQLDEERDKIRKTTADELLERHRMLDAEKDKQMQDMKKTIEELQQKAHLTSQQLQGEVQELELENVLKTEFPLDEIAPVGKGINGADVVQKVRDSRGQVCGVIVWESKRTKTWDKSWGLKLKEDMLRVKGDVAVLVSVILPENLKNFGQHDGVYVTNFDCFTSVAAVIRSTLIEQHRIKGSVVGKNEKMEMVYNYFLSSEFRQRVESIVNAFAVMKQDLEEEKKVMSRVWAKREKQIERVLYSTNTISGDIQGLTGSETPEISALEATVLLDDNLTDPISPTEQITLLEDTPIAEA